MIELYALQSDLCWMMTDLARRACGIAFPVRSSVSPRSTCGKRLPLLHEKKKQRDSCSRVTVALDRAQSLPGTQVD